MPLRLELRNKKGETVVHKQEFVSGRRVRVALEMQDEFERNMELTHTQTLDKLVEFVAGTFDDKAVTEDAILDGIEADELFEVLNGVVDQVMGKKKEPKEVVAQE